MRSWFSCTTLSLTVLAASASFAQSPEEAQALAQPREGETADLDLQTIRRYGDVLGRFEVTIVWTDSSKSIPEDYRPRRVRYMANCEEMTTMLAAVTLYDRNGAFQKGIVVPPRAIDPVKPEKGTEPAKWLRRVCMF
jgi:hypothetical protein